MKRKYIKDYVSDGKGEYHYSGKYYISRQSQEERKKASVIQSAYSIACFILIFVALGIPCQGNRTIYVVIPMELTMVCQAYFFLGSLALGRWQDKEGRMEQKDYDKMYQGPMQVLTIATILYLFSLGGQVIGMFMKNVTEGNGDLFFCMILVFILLLSVFMWNRQKKGMHTVTEEKAVI